MIPIEEADVVLVVENLVPWIPHGSDPPDDAWIAFARVDPAAITVPLSEHPSDLRIVADPADFLETLLPRWSRMDGPPG